MHKAIAMSMVVGLLRTSLISFCLILFPTLIFADDSTSLNNFATHINGESLMYFILIIFIGYLFFRKPLP